MNRLAPAAAAAVTLVAALASAAAARPLTLDEALALARERAPVILAARARVDEARGRLLGAAVLLRENPTLGVGFGPRVRGPAGVAVEAQLSQTFELGGRRSARIDGARAAVARAVATDAEAGLRALREAAVAFYRALHAQERLKLAARAVALAEATLHIAARRHQAGDVPVLHVNVARGALARARSERLAIEATLTAVVGELRIVLGLDPTVALVLQGDLGDHSRFERLAAAPRQDTERPDVRVVAAEVREAEADLRLGRGLGWPDLGVGVRYTQEEVGASAVLGTVSLTLPLFDRGQGVRAEARARERRLRVELDATRRRAGIEVLTAIAVYRQRVAALVELQAVAPVQEHNEALARRSYEMGQLGLADLLLVHREVLETQVDFLARQLEAASAGIELEAAAGALR
ncbi:MAG TPA: TolC family protein [Polyangia bacterium]|jgi:cobalt-zinc-cadmium efflux system outer membrane protein